MPRMIDYAALGSTPAAGDKFIMIDVSDTSQSAQGTTKIIDADYVALADGTLTTITGGGTIALNGYTLTLSAGGTIDLSGGTLTLTAGSLSVTTGGTLDLNSQTLALTATTGGGTINLNGKTLALATGNLTVTANAAGTAITINEDGTLSLGGNTLSIDDGNVTITAGTLDLNAQTLTITSGGTLALGGFTLTGAKTGTLPVGTGTDGRVAKWDGDANTLAADTLAKTGAGVLTLASAGAYTLTAPKTGTLPVGTGTDGRVAKWSGDTNTLAADTLAKTGTGVITIASDADYTATVAKTGTVAMTSDISVPHLITIYDGFDTLSWETVGSAEQLDMDGTQANSGPINFSARPVMARWLGRDVYGADGYTATLHVVSSNSPANPKILLKDLTNDVEIYDTGTGTESAGTVTTWANSSDFSQHYEWTLSLTYADLSTGPAWLAFKVGNTVGFTIAYAALILTPS